MRKDLERIVKIPEGVSVEVSGNYLIVKGNGKEMKRKIDLGKLNVKVESGEIKLSIKNATRRESKIIGTLHAHLNNMLKGAREDFVYKMEICNAHFPMTVKVEGNNLIIKSFLGEKKDRKAKIVNGTKVDVKGKEIEISSSDIEAAGQTAANIESSTKLKGRDKRIFQDGIFITEKPGREI